MTTRTPVVLGFVVVGRGKDKRGADREEKLSRRYASKAAAEEFMRLARAGGRIAGSVTSTALTTRAGYERAT